MDRFNGIFNKVFSSSKKAIVYCQNLARLCGFSVRIRTSKTTTIYIVCSREGLPETNRELAKKRSRNSERCNCEWRIVLYRRSCDQWEFRNGKTMEHNHVIYSSEAYLEAEEKLPARRSISPMHLAPYQSSSPLPSLRSLDLPTPCMSEHSTPKSDTPPETFNNLTHLPPLTKALAKIMPMPSPHPLL
ncbi:hypothetical protein DSO57_1011902 [Entomophthora muscae]|uniref:Uncharacterized protein n=1 Tax=Entomophthora muscae TaxID=34485 RepID=A0ACC2TUQ5_9FUNG|nr:hypothetical protein DSO57_1011902 [Entomophthora muscae]